MIYNTATPVTLATQTPTCRAGELRTSQKTCADRVRKVSLVEVVMTPQVAG